MDGWQCGKCKTATLTSSTWGSVSKGLRFDRSDDTDEKRSSRLYAALTHTVEDRLACDGLFSAHKIQPRRALRLQTPLLQVVDVATARRRRSATTTPRRPHRPERNPLLSHSRTNTLTAHLYFYIRKKEVHGKLLNIFPNLGLETKLHGK